MTAPATDSLSGIVGDKPRVTVCQGRSSFTMHRPDGWRKLYLSDELHHWTTDGFCAAWLDALAWAATPAIRQHMEKES